MSRYRIIKIEMSDIKGLKVGSQITHFDINLKGANIIFIKGENGSGKSSIMKNICLNNKGYTNTIPVDTVTGGFIKITYTNGTNTFELEHLYMPNKKGMKYMSILSSVDKNGVKTVLTNDSIRDARQSVSSIFKVDYKNLRLMYVSEMDKNILDLNSVDRKTFFYNNIKHIDEYQKHYQNVSEKAKMIKRNISSIEIRKNKFNLVNMNIERDNLRNFLSSLEEQMSKLISDKADLRNKKLNVRDNMTDNIYEEAVKNIETLNKLKAFINRYNQLEDDTFGSLNDIGEYYLAKKEGYIELVQEHKSNLDKLLLEKQSTVNRIFNNEENIKLLSQGEDRSYDEELADAKKELLSIIVKPVIYPDLDTRTISGMKVDFDVLFNTVGRFGFENGTRGKVLNDYMSDEKKHMSVMLQYENYKKLHIEDQSRLKEIYSELSIIHDTLSTQRPGDCKFTNCGLANTYLTRKSDYELERDNILKNTDTVLKSMSKIKAEFGEFLLITQEDIFKYKEMNSILNLINSKYGSYDIIKRYLNNRSRLMGGEFPFDIINQLINIESNYYNIEKQKRYKALVEELDYKVRTPTSLTIMKTKTEIVELQETLISLDKDILETETQLKDYTNILNKTKKNHDSFVEELRFEELRQVTSTHLEVVEESLYRSNKIIEKFKDTSGNIHDINQDIKSLEEKHIELKDTHKHTNTKMMDIEFDIRTKENLEIEHDDMFKKLEKVSLIRSALSPKAGIPLYLITKYAYKLKDMVNALLENAESEYKIYDFIINDKEFIIQIIENGNIRQTEDLSGGERSIISLAISLSLNKLFNPEIGFILLDELDATLSSSFRLTFNNILDNCGYQVFMISHNESQVNLNVNKKIINIDKFNKTIELI